MDATISSGRIQPDVTAFSETTIPADAHRHSLTAQPADGMRPITETTSVVQDVLTTATSLQEIITRDATRQRTPEVTALFIQVAGVDVIIPTRLLHPDVHLHQLILPDQEDLAVATEVAAEDALAEVAVAEAVPEAEAAEDANLHNTYNL